MLQDNSHTLNLTSQEAFHILADCDRDFWENAAVKEYDIFLDKLGVDYQIQDPWLVVGKTEKIQGWKLHISSIPQEIIPLLSVIIPVLLKHNIPFKFVRNEIILMQLNEGHLGATQIGKCITIYPCSDHQAQQIAEILVKITPGFSGPVIPTDLHLGNNIYTRYGGFSSILFKDRLGLVHPSIYGLDGSLQLDNYTVPFSDPVGILNPFADFTETSQMSGKYHQLLEYGYLFLELIKEHPKGAVLRVLDVTNPEKTTIKILKQGRKYCVSDQYGRDIRTRLKYQEFLHQTLSGLVPVPQVESYFEVNGDGYLPLEYIEGQSFDSFVNSKLSHGTWHSLALQEKVELLSYLEKLLDAIQQLHSVGYVHRDLTGANIWIGTDEKVYLLDLELTHAVDDRNPVFVIGTPGFMSPQQEMGNPPAFSDDIYALGCVMILLFTNLPPHLVNFVREGQRVSQLLELVNGLPIELIEIMAQCVKSDAQARPDLKTIKNLIQYTQKNISERPIKSNLVEQETLHNLIFKAQKGLLDDVITKPETGLWLSAAVNQISHPDINVAKLYELRRSTNIGVAGVVYLLSRLARFGYSTEEAGVRVQQAVQWLLTDADTPDQELPGLHFGEAGVAVALAEAIASGLITRNHQIDAFFTSALSGELDWHDITHGAAGQGVAVLYCADRLQDASLLHLVHRCAEYLINTQKPNGSWEVPPGVNYMSGQILTGFAHGVAGIVYFLCEYAKRFSNHQAEQAWQIGTEWLFEQAILTPDEQALVWYHSDVRPETWKWWCHGSPGIALTFLRLYELTQNEAYAEIATHALQVHPVDIRYRNLSQCHGLSGLGDIYLEAARVLGDQQWLERANAIAHTLLHLRRETSTGSVTWLVENFHQPTADLMVGASGIVHFLLRLYLPGEKIGLPLLLDPC
jgi:serine/threonine protein kinase